MCCFACGHLEALLARVVQGQEEQDKVVAAIAY